MTFALFIIAFVVFFFGALNLLPPIEPLPVEFINGFQSIVGAMKAWDSIFPITELLALVIFVVTFDLALWLFKWVIRIIHIVRGTGTQ